MEKMEEKIKKIAILLGEPVWRVKEALGIQSGQIDYSSWREDDLKIAFRDSSPDSQEEYYIQKEFSRRLSAEISSGALNKVRDAYFLATELELEEVKLIAFQVWDELSLAEVVKASDYTSLKTACDMAPKFGRARILAHKKKEEVLEESFKIATTIDDYVKIFKKAPSNSNLRSEVVKQMIELFDN